MKLAIAAVVFSAVFAGSASAQSNGDTPPPPPNTGMHHGGPHGPGAPRGWGHGMGGHRVEAIANAPFTAQFTESGTFTDRQGAQQQHSSTSIIFRDSLGRVREEVTLPARPPRPPAAGETSATPAAPPAPRGPRTIITIFDPVAHTITHLNPERQTAFVQAVPADFFSRMQQHEEAAASGQLPHGGRDKATTTSLGSKMFAGLSATGEQTTMTFPAREGGTAHTKTRQSWFSPEEKLVVSSMESGDRGTHTDTLSSFSRAEPNPSLFQVPAGYTITNAPERGGWHRGGPGGDDAGTEAPPPSM